MAGIRTYLSDFALANPVYAGATVSVFEVDIATLEVTTTLATLYDAISGTGTLTNPQTLDSEGKWVAPPYVETAVVMQVSGASVPSHQTGITQPVENSINSEDVVLGNFASNGLTLGGMTATTDLVIQANGGTTQIGGTMISGGRSMTGSSNPSLRVPAYLRDTSGAITHNTWFRSAALSNTGPTEHYTTLHQGVIDSGSTKARMVPGYFQGQNLASGAAPGDARVVWAIVAEARDDSGQPSSTGAQLLAIEVDVEAAGLDDAGTRRGVVVIFSKTDAAASMEGSHAFQAFTSTASTIKTSFKASAVHSEAVFDSRDSTLNVGAHGMWLATGHDIALDTSANTKISSNATIITATGALAATGNITAASAVQGVEIGTIGSVSVVRAAGTGTNLDLRSGTAAGAVRIRNSDAATLAHFSAAGVTSPVNYFEIFPVAAGVAGPRLTAAGTDTDINIRLVPKGTGIVTASTSLTVLGDRATATKFWTPDSPSTLTFSGAYAFAGPGKFHANLAGTATVSGDTNGALVSVGSSNDNFKSSAGHINYLYVFGQTGNDWQGARRGIAWQLQTSANVATATTAGLVGLGGLVAMNHSVGGTALAPNGSNFGGNIRAKLGNTATFYDQLVGLEIGTWMESTTSASRYVGLQLVNESQHAAHGSVIDASLLIGSQTGAIAPYHTILLGDGYSGLAWNPNGYIMRAKRGNNSNAGQIAGGIDFNTLDLTGVGDAGGGFAFRSPGVQIITSAVQIGYGKLASIGTGLSIDTVYTIMAGTPTVAAGGTAWTTGDSASDIYGNQVRIIASAGVVTSVSVISRGALETAPANPVAFTKTSGATNSGGTGLTLNLTWTPQTRLSLQPSGGSLVLGAAGSTVALFGGTPVAKPTGVAITAAGIHAALVSLNLIAA